MNLTDVEKLISLFGSISFGALIGGLIVYFLLKSFLPSYLSEKGKNLATKEDIASITEKVESVKIDYARILEDFKSNNQLKLAEIEREKNIKKEVYLQAIEALTRTLNIVSSLPNLNIDDQTLTTRMQNDSGFIAKVQIVGSEKTVKATTTILALIGTAVLELTLERNILVERKKEITLIEEFRARSDEEIDRYISIMKNLNIEGNIDQRIWDTINNNVNFEKQRSKEFSQRICELYDIQIKEQLNFTKKCMSYFFDITLVLPKVVLAIREELNLNISDEAYLDIYNENVEIGKKIFGDFLIKISNYVDT